MRQMQLSRFLLAVILLCVAGCEEVVAPEEVRVPNGAGVEAKVYSFRVRVEPQGRDTIDRIAVHSQRLRLPGERLRWRLVDLQEHTVTFVDEIARTVERRSFAEILDDLRESATRDEGVPVARVVAGGQEQILHGQSVELYVMTLGSGYTRRLWITREPFIHEDIFLLLLATNPPSNRNLPALRELIGLFDRIDGYPLLDESAMTLSEVEHTIERTLIAVADEIVPGAWFELPDWAEAALTESLAGRRPGASDLPDRSTRAAESRPFS
jgi:hypothetical protein